jgi:multiple sugar transport system substrate-binding protein
MINEDESSVMTDWVQGPTSFAKGNAAMIVASSGLITSAPEDGGVRMGTALFPTWGDKPRRVPVGGNATFIFAQEERQQLAAWEFVKYVNSPEGLAIWTRATGYLPTRSQLAEGSGPIADYYRDNPLLTPELDQVEDYVPWVSWPGSQGPEAEQALIDARDRVLSGEADASKALPEVAERINEMIGG